MGGHAASLFLKKPQILLRFPEVICCGQDYVAGIRMLLEARGLPRSSRNIIFCIYRFFRNSIKPLSRFHALGFDTLISHNSIAFAFNLRSTSA